MPESRQSVRKSRYQTLRSLGYTAADARRLRDNRATKIDSSISTRQESLERIPSKRRTKFEKVQLQNIREYRKQTVASRTAISTRSTRLEQFRDWTSRREFPTDVLRYVAAINKTYGVGPRNSYGFRVFYHEFVNGNSHSLALQVGERGDSPREK